jgi:hypothetical protein
MLAQKFYILPRRLDCREAALACHRLHIAERIIPVSFTERLEALSKHKDVLVITKGPANSDQPELAAQALGTLHIKKSYRELRFSREKSSLRFLIGIGSSATQTSRRCLSRMAGTAQHTPNSRQD